MDAPSVIFFGSKPGAAAALELLLKRGWDVKCVVVARNVDLSWYGGESVEGLASSHDIRVLEQADLSGDVTADFVISYQFRNLIKKRVLAMARHAALNFHAAPLPGYAGWAIYNLAILENAPLYGCTCHNMDHGFDTGPLVKVRLFPIDVRNETAYSLESRTQREMLRLFADVCYTAEENRVLPSIPQDKSKMRYLSLQQLQSLKRIPDDADQETVDRYSRAFWYPPYECAYILYNGTKVEIVPDIAKAQLGQLLHQNDLGALRADIQDYCPQLCKWES